MCHRTRPALAALPIACSANDLLPQPMLIWLPFHPTSLPLPPRCHSSAGTAPAVPIGPGLAVSFTTSVELTPEFVGRLEAELVASRNHFVCLQLATMAREAMAAAAAAALAATTDDRHRLCAAAVAAASQQHFATLEAGGRLVAAALFYPRVSSSLPPAATQGGNVGSAGGITPAPGSSQLDPHCVLELICTNAPGRGWGSLLLQHVERYVAAHAAGRLALGGHPLRCLKLLSVDSAQSFYRSNGYGEPDACKEMHKLLCDVRL